MVTNSYILCRNYTDLQIKMVKDFRVTLAKQLIGDYVLRKRPGRRSNTSAARRFCQSHFPLREADRGCYHKKKGRHQCATYSCVTMVKTMTVFASTIYATAPHVKIKDYSYRVNNAPINSDIRYSHFCSYSACMYIYTKHTWLSTITF